MKLLFGSALLASATVLSAQAPANQGAAANTHPSPRTYFIEPPSRCSSWMRLQQGSSTQMIRTEDGKSLPLMTPKLILRPGSAFGVARMEGPANSDAAPSPHSDKSVKGAIVTVHGYPPVAGVQPLAGQLVLKSQKGKPSEITRKLFITFKPENSEYAAQLRLPGFTAVTSIDVHSITYADGTTWSPDKKNSCSVKADPFLLVSAAS